MEAFADLVTGEDVGRRALLEGAAVAREPPVPLDPVRPRPLVEQAAERLRAQITAGEWPVGSKLPGETTLAAELGVGRSTVREALRALAGAGLVRPR